MRPPAACRRLSPGTCECDPFGARLLADVTSYGSWRWARLSLSPVTGVRIGSRGEADTRGGHPRGAEVEARTAVHARCGGADHRREGCSEGTAVSPRGWSQIKASAARPLLEALRESLCRASRRFWGLPSALSVPWIVDAPLQSLLPLSCLSPYVSTFTRTLVIALGRPYSQIWSLWQYRAWGWNTSFWGTYFIL